MAASGRDGCVALSAQLDVAVSAFHLGAIFSGSAMQKIRRLGSKDGEHSVSTDSLIEKANAAGREGRAMDAGTMDALFLSEDGDISEETMRATTQSRNRDQSDMWMWDDTLQSREVLLALFMMVDKLGDGSGSMSSTELMHVLINLGEDVDDECADVRQAYGRSSTSVLLCVLPFY